MKRIWKTIGSSVKNGTFQKKAVDHVEKIEKGETKVLAPKYPSEKKRDVSETVKKDLDTKHESLVENMNKMKIRSTDPPERWTSAKNLPTRESEFLHRNDPVWEYGFYEPPAEKIPKDKLMFREALEYIRARQEANDDKSTEKQRINSLKYISQHNVSSRVNPDLLEDIYEYFRPFERKDTQKVVNRQELANLQDHLQGTADQRKLLDSFDEIKENVQKISSNAKFLDQYQKLENEEKKKFREAIAQLRQEEHDRLNRRLSQIDEMEKETQEAMKKAEKDQEKK